MKLEAKSRIQATKVTASFDPAALEKDGADPKVVALLKSLNSKMKIKYAQHEAGATEAELYPEDDSAVSGGSVFQAPGIVVLGRIMMELSKLGETEVHINTDTPSKPFLQLGIYGEPG